ncbi:MAG: DNA cytosine methyltransferase [Methanobrevibacter sp.]|jgi:DNA (cytosine-5)-methyltransferase 1|nr:DNA cytosine methyltransferase [Candidatus Methanoflexus mossambicus]
MEKKVVELFAGGGGLALGLEMAGLEHEMLVEIDKDCVATLKHNRPEWNVIHEDIKEIEFKGVKSDIVTGGFPCQAFSYAGKKLGFEDTRGTLFFEFARAVKEIKPKICMAENVEGLVRHDNGRTLETMLEVLTDLGYNVQYKVLNAVNFNVPQKRKRMVLIGTLNGINFSYPKPNKKIFTIEDALKDVPDSDGINYSEKREKVLELVPPGGCWIDLPEDVKKEFMGKSYYSGGGKRGMARRMSWTEPCLTLTTSPSQKQTERCHPEETRPFTIREYARIQTFPDNWEFIGGKSSQYKQIGNAVPVKLGEILGKQLIKALDGKEKVSISKQAKLSAF